MRIIDLVIITIAFANAIVIFHYMTKFCRQQKKIAMLRIEMAKKENLVDYWKVKYKKMIT